ncbi:fibrinogen-like protein A [Anopheles albimanus]|uniref:Fibrinogen C-terminal domain-containing protein n=1 Tax=Anopheles albimanus TaxID=7167 RepID=A0A8W7JBZ9_ANOAL|nr:fibrinogen-like protein A [Anopheles albimanus]
MKLTVCFILFYASMCAANKSNRNTITVEPEPYAILGFGLELLLTKLDHIHSELHKELHKHHASHLATLHKLEQHLSVQSAGCCKGNKGQSSFIISNVISATSTPSSKSEQPSYSSCKNLSTKVSGTYLIRVNSDSEPIKVFCEQEKFGGGWLVVQHRFDGTTNFNRSWIEYRDGFGDVEKEFWFGLEKMHQITTARTHEIIIELMDFSGTYKYARYDAFKIGDESEQYSLNILGTYSGTAGDSMSYSKGMKFTTKDRDNDRLSNTQCAHYTAGAWWHNACTYVNLNGLYVNANNSTSMLWFKFKDNQQGLSFSRMMIREVE